ncbi:serine/threonine-protein kinase [Streptomyces collinus]|uniref:serine/threonine-protein kinase n=1 Tax=Streptomyces collinus TaxID=42684 RepID=UPI003684FA3D
MDTWAVPGYTNLRELGAGASGRVVLARHEDTNVRVAIKYLSKELQRRAGFLDRFRAEATLLAGLRSSHVTGLYEYVENTHGAVIVMELIDGVALRQLLTREGKIGPESALLTLKGSLLGLEAAHRIGIVHRDYKPENVLIDEQGFSKLVDFGIAVHDGATPGLAGTPLYMAPELWSGDQVTPAADIYAATATFYECLTGRRPFSGQNFAELAYQHVTASVPTDDIPEPVLPIILRGMAKSPQDRPSDATALVRELEQIAHRVYGPEWETTGRLELAALVGLFPHLLLKSSRADQGSTDTAVTEVRGEHRVSRYFRQNRTAVAASSAALSIGSLFLLYGMAFDGDSLTHAVDGVRATTSQRPSKFGTSDDPSREGYLYAPSTGAIPNHISPRVSKRARGFGNKHGKTGQASPLPSASGHPRLPSDAPTQFPQSTTPTSTSGPTEPPTPTTPTSTPDPTEPPTPTTPTSTSGPTEPPTPTTPTSTPDPTEPPTPTTPTSTPASTPPAPEVTVRDVSLTDFRQTGPDAATLEFDIDTNGPGQFTLEVVWFTSNESGKLGNRDGAVQTLQRSGARHYKITLAHSFADSSCFWSAQITSTPAAAGGAASKQILAQRCVFQ